MSSVGHLVRCFLRKIRWYSSAVAPNLSTVMDRKIECFQYQQEPFVLEYYEWYRSKKMQSVKTVLDIRTDNRNLIVRFTQELGANSPSADAIVRRTKPF
ncbi:unnamed protein product [Gongylonema pulchrum]|uniref:Uncharacterized protein n=1 Tax=Gongylonema pulchrum TaxID=637853 RepID=A0A183ESZ2_9BILA|nr:unnamed protein product [Gongylonema pulchrum]